MGIRPCLNAAGFPASFKISEPLKTVLRIFSGGTFICSERSCFRGGQTVCRGSPVTFLFYRPLRRLILFSPSGIVYGRDEARPRPLKRL